ECLAERAIQLQRRDRHVTLHHGMEVRAWPTILDVSGDRNPIAFLATRVGLLDRRLGAAAMPKTGKANTTDVIQRQVRHVHTEYRARRQVELIVFLDQRPGDGSS